MSLFAKFFGRKPGPPKPAAPLPSSADPARDPNLIMVYDSYGREVYITRQQWRDNILVGNIEKAWNRPDDLYQMIVSALNDGFRSDIVDAARQLYKIDPLPSRGACIWGIVLMEEGRLDESEQVYRDFMSKHGEDGVILTNLAKIYAKRKDDARSLETLWHALELDPNQDNGLGWYEVIHRERSGEDAGLEALRRIAALPRSWRAQLWLARAALKTRDLENALGLYRESLSRVGRDVPSDLLRQVSGDLGNAGHLPELLQLVEPHFVVENHGLAVGNNLIKAHLDLGQLDAARTILDRLFALKRPDWKENLAYWDTEIAKAKLSVAQPEPRAPLKMAMLTIEGPIWLKPASPAAELFPARPPNALTVFFLGSAAEMATNSKRIQHQLSDAAGRLSRALPLFLAEQVEFRSLGRTKTLVPWVAERPGGFVLGGCAWTDDDAANYSRQGGLNGDYVVVSYLQTVTEPWTLNLRLVRSIDGKCLGTLAASFANAHPGQEISALATNLLALLTAEAGIESAQPPAIYQVPAEPQFGYYLLRLEQLLAVRCGGMDGTGPGFLNGEREIIDGNLQLCLAHPHNVSVRILLAQTLVAMKRVRPDILPEFKYKLTLLQKEQPLTEPAHSVVQRLINETLAV